jgi:hypothetical protein
MKPWSADHAAGRITRPLRHNGIPYKGINVIMLWSASVTKGYACPLWLTFKQAIELGGHVKKGESGELVVYANTITRTETDDKGEETEREIPFMKGYTVFNAEQCEDLPAHYTAKAEAPDDCPNCGLRHISPERSDDANGDEPDPPLRAVEGAGGAASRHPRRARPGRAGLGAFHRPCLDCPLDRRRGRDAVRR